MSQVVRDLSHSVSISFFLNNFLILHYQAFLFWYNPISTGAFRFIPLLFFLECFIILYTYAAPEEKQTKPDNPANIVISNIILSVWFIHKTFFCYSISIFFFLHIFIFHLLTILQGFLVFYVLCQDFKSIFFKHIISWSLHARCNMLVPYSPRANLFYNSVSSSQIQ